MSFIRVQVNDDRASKMSGTVINSAGFFFALDKYVIS